MVKQILLIIFICIFSTACSVETTVTAETPDIDDLLCNFSISTTSFYLMAFHSCDTDCSDPSNHTVQLATSADGALWTLVEEFEPFAGSVPELLFQDNELVLFALSDNQAVYKKYDGCFEVTAQGEVELTSDTDTGFVDPSLVLSGETPVLFYLPGVIGMDPAGCSSYPCTKEIHSAQGSADFSSFTMDSGARASATLSFGTFSDPEILAHSNGIFYLYVSSGQDTVVYTSSTLNGTFESPDGDSQRKISNGSGGVPSAVENSDGTILLYVTTSDETRLEVIRRAVSTDGITPVPEAEFSTVVDSSVSTSFSGTTSVSSPSVVFWEE